MRKALGKKTMARLGMSERVGAQFCLRVHVSHIDVVVAEPEWSPVSFILEWKRSARLVTTEDRPWVKVSSDTYRISMDQELSMVTTLYHKEVGAGFDKKEFRFQVEEVCAGKSNRVVANATVDISPHVDMLGAPAELPLALKAVSRKAKSVVACAQIRAEFLRDDVKQDQDQLSILSGATMTRSDQMALDSEDDLDQSSEYGSNASLNSAVGLEITADQPQPQPAVKRRPATPSKTKTKLKADIGSLLLADHAPPDPCEVKPLMLTESRAAAAESQSDGEDSSDSEDEALIQSTASAIVAAASSETADPTAIIKLRAEFALKEAAWMMQRSQLEGRIQQLEEAPATEAGGDAQELRRVAEVKTRHLRTKIEEYEALVARLEEANRDLAGRLDGKDAELGRLRLLYETTERQNRKLKAKPRRAPMTKNNSMGPEMGRLAHQAKELCVSTMTVSGPMPGMSLMSVSDKADPTENAGLIEELIRVKTDLAAAIFAYDEVRLEKKGVAKQLAQEKLRCMEFSRRMTEIDTELQTLRAKAKGGSM